MSDTTETVALRRQTAADDHRAETYGPGESLRAEVERLRRRVEDLEAALHLVTASAEVYRNERDALEARNHEQAAEIERLRGELATQTDRRQTAESMLNGARRSISCRKDQTIAERVEEIRAEKDEWRALASSLYGAELSEPKDPRHNEFSWLQEEEMRLRPVLCERCESFDEQDGHCANHGLGDAV